MPFIYGESRDCPVAIEEAAPHAKLPLDELDEMRNGIMCDLDPKPGRLHGPGMESQRLKATILDRCAAKGIDGANASAHFDIRCVC